MFFHTAIIHHQLCMVVILLWIRSNNTQCFVYLCRFNRRFRTCLAVLPASLSTLMRPLPLEQPSRVVFWLVMSLMCCCWMWHRCLWVLKLWVASSPNSSTGTPQFRQRRVRYFNLQLHELSPSRVKCKCTWSCQLQYHHSGSMLMHIDASCELTCIKLSSCDWITQDRCWYQIWNKVS